MNNGWIKIHRRIQNNWLWKGNEPFDKRSAWIDILLEANHADAKVSIGNSIITCKRGESLNSLHTWARRWKWSRSRVRRFLLLLESDKMIRLKSEQKTTHLTVRNYDSYQETRNDCETIVKRKRNDSETIVDTNKKNKKNKNKSTVRFGTFWSAYPNKKSKAKALLIWDRNNLDKKIDTIISAIEAQKKSKQWTRDDGQFIPLPTTWLNGERWEDEITTVTKRENISDILARQANERR